MFTKVKRLVVHSLTPIPTIGSGHSLLCAHKINEQEESEIQNNWEGLIVGLVELGRLIFFSAIYP